MEVGVTNRRFGLGQTTTALLYFTPSLPIVRRPIPMIGDATPGPVPRVDLEVHRLDHAVGASSLEVIGYIVPAVVVGVPGGTAGRPGWDAPGTAVSSRSGYLVPGTCHSCRWRGGENFAILSHQSLSIL